MMRIFIPSLILAAGMVAATAGTAQTAPAARPMKADTDRSGTVTRAEFVAQADARFAQMDTNRDGQISRDEMTAFRKAARERRMERRAERRGTDGRTVTRKEATDRAAARFDRLDTNRDGKLDAAERAAGRPMRGRHGGMMPPSPSAPGTAAPAAPHTN